MDNTVHEAHYNYGSRLVKAYSLDTGLENIDQHGPQRQNLISTSPVTFNSDPRQNSNLQCDVSTGNSRGSTRKRLGMEIGRWGGTFVKNYSTVASTMNVTLLSLRVIHVVLFYTMLILLMIISLLIQVGVGKLALHSFPNSH